MSAGPEWVALRRALCAEPPRRGPCDGDPFAPQEVGHMHS